MATELFVKCSKCGGTGFYSGSEGLTAWMGNCPDCKGKGVMPATPEQIVEAAKNYILNTNPGLYKDWGLEGLTPLTIRLDWADQDSGDSADDS